MEHLKITKHDLLLAELADYAKQKDYVVNTSHAWEVARCVVAIVRPTKANMRCAGKSIIDRTVLAVRRQRDGSWWVKTAGFKPQCIARNDNWMLDRINRAAERLVSSDDLDDLVKKCKELSQTK